MQQIKQVVVTINTGEGARRYFEVHEKFLVFIGEATKCLLTHNQHKLL